MSLQCGLFDSTEITETEQGYPRGNKAQNAAFFARYFASFVGSGVYRNPSTSFQVLTTSGMTVEVRPGSAFLCGYFCFDDETETHTFQTDVSGHEYDAVLRLNADLGTITLEWITDPASGTIPVRSGGIYDLLLARISVPTGATSLSASMITDCRADPAVCGFVSSLVDGIGSVVDFAQTAEQLTETLPLGKGGTGAETAADARQNLGLGSAAILSAGTANGAATLDSYGKLTASQKSSGITLVNTSRNLTVSDAGRMLMVNTPSDITLTLPASQAFPSGAEIGICRYGSGNVTIAPGGVLINGSSSSFSIISRYACFTLKHFFTGEWIAVETIV